MAASTVIETPVDETGEVRKAAGASDFPGGRAGRRPGGESQVGDADSAVGHHVPMAFWGLRVLDRKRALRSD